MLSREMLISMVEDTFRAHEHLGPPRIPRIEAINLIDLIQKNTPATPEANVEELVEDTYNYIVNGVVDKLTLTDRYAKYLSKKIVYNIISHTPQSEDKVDGWIECSDRLPEIEEGGFVNVYACCDGMVIQAWFNMTTKGFQYTGHDRTTKRVDYWCYRDYPNPPQTTGEKS